ncbi:WD40 repeat domain-containing protein [Thermocatellispora tengchongensis]|uniref:hypothetical protein n=1 Tax=Thermocatellispora tengchongensis TaxID=1073253 RepID=UPI0036260B55
MRDAGRSTSMCAVTLNGQVTLAIAGLNGLRIDFPNRPDLRWVQPGAFTHVTAFTGAGGPRLATTGPDQTLRIWDTRTRKIERTLVGHTGTVTASCAFTLGERRLLATASADHTVRIWDPAVDGFEQGRERPRPGDRPGRDRRGRARARGLGGR